MVLTPGGIVAWLVAGLIAGWVAGKIMRGHDFGLVGDLAVGTIGSLLGGLIADAFLPDSISLNASIGIAFASAAMLLILIRVVGSRREAV
jgi:uncharacterized membrane protein YeaQ/YmgE (transglycosylase-associated protein family)